MMKKIISAITASALLLSLSACGETSQKASESEETKYSSEERTTKKPTEESDDDSSEFEDSDINEAREQSYTEEISDSEKPEVTSVTISGKCEGDIAKIVHITDLFNVNMLHSGVVGLVGVPVDIDCRNNIKNMKLTFEYNPDELRGVPEKNLIVLYYDEREGMYGELSGDVDTDNHTVTVNIKRDGAYMLVDAYEWLSCWGADVSEYEYEKDSSSYETDWERQKDTGSIMELADKKWVAENAPYFSVSTPEELAGAVYYVNGLANGENVSIELTADIDLAGYDWKPMGWYGASSNCFSGTFNGNGHTIANMKINTGESETAFIGYGLNTYVTDVTFINAEVNGSAQTGVVGGEIYMSSVWDNITLVNCTVNGAGTDCSTIIGREAGTAFRDCTVKDVIVNGERSDYFSYRQKIVEETEVTETFKLERVGESFTFKRDDHDGFRNLGWVFERDGVELLDRNAENETEYDASWLFGTPGTYHVYLNAFIGETYIRVSNLIEITIE